MKNNPDDLPSIVYGDAVEQGVSPPRLDNLPPERRKGERREEDRRRKELQQG